MSKQEKDYSFLNNVDTKMLVAMAILTTALTAFAIGINIAIRGDGCTREAYIYCGEDKSHGHGDAEHH